MPQKDVDDKQDQAGRQDPLPNVWARKGEHNPYLHNVFALLGIDPDEGERAFQRKVRRTEKRLEAGQELVVHGRQLKLTDVTHAKDLAADVVQFVAERLLFHTVHKVDRDAFDKHAKTLEAMPFQRPQELLPLPIRDLTMLTGLLPDLDEVAGDEPTPLSSEKFRELVAPLPEEEKIYDL